MVNYPLAAMFADNCCIINYYLFVRFVFRDEALVNYTTAGINAKYVIT